MVASIPHTSFDGVSGSSLGAGGRMDNLNFLEEERNSAERG